MPLSELNAELDGENADPVADPDRFYRQARLLAKCAELVYPGVQEQSEQKTEEQARSAYRRKRRWWRCLAKHSPEEEKLKLAWYDAADALNTKSKQRIENELKDLLPFPHKVEFVNSCGTQCFVARSDRHIIVCFRGTESDQRRDILSDVLCFQTKCEGSNARIHFGFADALRFVWEKIDGSPTEQSTLRQLLEKKELDKKELDNKDLHKKEKESVTLRDKGQTVWITGHSLGGALATLAADQLIREKILESDDIGGVFTFGQPRVGDGQFSNEYRLHDRHFRFVNNNDVVTRVPPQNMMLIFSVLGGLVGLGGKKSDTSEPERQWKLIYRDVGNVVFVNRSDKLKLLKRGIFWWKVQLFWGRTVSRLSAPFTGTKGRSLMKRLSPGLDDHGMAEYNRALEKRTAVAVDASGPSSVAESTTPPSSQPV